ncbi:MAG TPA: AAA family ATPase [Longimicrobiaceae bacterium]
MYEVFFGLDEKPFSITPNPRFIFYSEHYRAALEHLLYGLQEKEGFMLVTGPVGTGKTTLCRELLASVDGDRCRTALVFNPFLNAVEMLQALLSEFGCSYPAGATRKDLLDRLNRFLLEELVEGRTCIAIFDEAQHLSEAFLEQIRVLSNLETDNEKLLQIILVGQPELRERIQQPSLAQLDQRVSVRCVLRHLTDEETEQYVYHRLNVAGARGGVRFTRRAIARLHGASRGVPRLINLIADRTLLAGFVDRTLKLSHVHVERGLASLQGEASAPKPAGRRLRARLWWLRSRAGAAVASALAGLAAAARVLLGGIS